MTTVIEHGPERQGLMTTTDPTTVDGARLTRAQRASLPLSAEVVQALAEQHGVCTRPLVLRRIDTTSGRVDIVPVPCGSIREDQCHPCADKARRLRMVQCRQGWHLDTEPITQRTRPTEQHQELMAARADLVAAYTECKTQGDEASCEQIADSVAELDTELRALGVRGRFAPIDPPLKPRKRSTRRRKNNRRRVPGITIYQRGKKWSYTIYGEPDILTGKRDRINAGGFESEDDAWSSALKKHAEIDRGRKVKPSTRTVEQYLTEWLNSVKHSLKPSAYANYSTNVSAYIIPKIGRRKLQDISVPVLNALYVHLLEAGRVKADGNGKMYEYWRAHRTLRNGLGPTPTELSKACGTSYQAAKEAVCRYRRGRVPEEYLAGLSPKSVRNIHRLLHRALSDAVAWDYLIFNPAEHASLPRERRRGRTIAQPWSVKELAQWLRCAQQDRFAGMWILAATTGMRRSELLGVRRDSLDLDAGTLTIDETLISVGGRAEESDGKTAAGVRTVSLDAFTIAALRRHLAMLDVEKQAFGPAYLPDGWLFVWPNGQRPHPDTVTDRFNHLVDTAGARRIRLHDVRHTYATLSLDSGMDPKILSDRVGHSNPTITFQVYTHRSTGRDRAAAQLIGQLIEDAVRG